MTTTLQGERLVQQAAALAEQWHEGQHHSFGSESYFAMHLKPIAHIVHRLGYSALFVACAYLHDIKEDTPISDTELDQSGIPPAVIHAVNLLTKREGQPHDEYLQGILGDPIATVVKFADSSFNFSWSVLNSSHVSDPKFRERVLEYSGNIAVLRPALPLPILD